jgi:hypothetical protein
MRGTWYESRWAEARPGWHPELRAMMIGMPPGACDCVNMSAWRGAFERARSWRSARAGGESSLTLAAVAPVLDDLAAARWVQAYDVAWLGKDWESLQQRLAPEVEFVVPGIPEPVIGSSFVVASLRETMNHLRIHEYNATDLKGYDCGSIGVITYRWQLDSSVGDGTGRSQSTGRDVLVLRAAAECWLLTWRGQFRA